MSGSAGSTLSQLYNPFAIYVDPNQMMYILDQTNYRVLRWKFGEPLGYVVAGGNGAGGSLTQISTSYAMFIDSQYNIYVSDSGNSRVSLWLPTNRTSGILVRKSSVDRTCETRVHVPCFPVGCRWKWSRKYS